MARKKPINLSVPAELLDEFYTVCRHYGHGKQKGQVLSAAMLMFLRADPEEQGRCLEQVVSADITEGVAQMIERARKEQGLRIAKREATQQPDDPATETTSHTTAAESEAETPKRQAAKPAPEPRQGFPEPPDQPGSESE
jgi:hypothetical protein